MLNAAMQSHGVFVRAGSMTGFASLVTRYGGNPDGLLSASGIDPRLLDNPENRLPLNTVATVLERTAQALKVPDFGLQLAGYQDISVLGAVALIVMNSTTIGEALDSITKYMAYHTPGGRLKIDDHERKTHVRLHYDLMLNEAVPRRHAVELSYALFYQFLCLAASETGANWEITFRHKQGLTPTHYRRFFGCPIKLGQPYDGLSVPHALLRTPINQASRELKATAERFVSNIVRRNPLDIGRQVVELAEQRLAHGGGKIKAIAGLLGLHPRTLQRRLEAQGLCFEDLIDKLRRELATDYLQYAAIPLAQITLMLGYSGQNAFTAACHRWFDMTPLQYRHHLLRGKAKRTLSAL